MTPAELNAELTIDPLALGYSAQLNISDNAIAAMLNALSGTGAASIALPSLTHDEFALLIAPVVMALGGATAAIQTQWTPMLNMIGGVQVVTLSSTILGMMSALSADFPTQLPAAAITAATTRIGSRAEVLWGVGVTVSPQDVAVAMGRP